MNSTFLVTGVKEQERRIKSQQRMEMEFKDSERKLNNINHKLQTVTNRLHNNFNQRIESLNQKNTRTHEIKVKMDRYEEESKEKHFTDYLKKQMEYMKRMKKLKKVIISLIICRNIIKE